MKIINPYKAFNGICIPNAILECKDLSQSAKLMWGCLARFAGRNGRCFPKIETLGERVGLSKSMARKVVKELRDKKFIMTKQATGKARLMHMPNEYFFLDHELFHKVEEVGAEGSINGTPVDSSPGVSKEGPEMGGPREVSQLRESSTTSDPEKISGGGSEKKKKHHGTPEDHVLALKMYKAILVVNATVKEPNWDRWANHIRLMREQDGRDHAQIWRVFDFANRDQFWCNNILSPGALRRHYSKLAPKSGAVKSGSGVRGVGADVVDHGSGYTCGQCMFANKGKWACGGHDADPDHKACEDLFRIADGVA